ASLESDRAEIEAHELRTNIAVTVISSGGQTPAQMAAQQALAARSERVRHIVAARSGHWIQFDEPELVVAAVRQLVTLQLPNSSTP
ncbi:MAG TPA: hypothetical protein VFS23_01030, partial [Vicinamibacterales bacterium]|nr:hypothetical protein [Vicinamibacterales bacterium]